ncbi:MAG: 3-deoxy-manno-octulosonate cytidylyltransferase [Magnetococcales bacterium]|nr:3-deoxy-manno-octulosonate cytidylyltransferase [Magnetococcales bacterium]
MKRSVCIIPARMGSSRFPGKPLEPLLGLPLVLHVLARCRLYEGFERVVIATCDQEIFAATNAYGGEAVMTGDCHERCTDRVEEAVRKLALNLDDDDLVVMIQGDEILVTPEMIDRVVEQHNTSGAPVINLASRLYRQEDFTSPDTVKVVMAPDNRALYFSRSQIPSDTRGQNAPIYQQTGVMAFTNAFLRHFGEMPQTPLEIIESVDMMRVLENGLPLDVVRTEMETIGVDTPDDLARAEHILHEDPTTSCYMDP